MSSSTGDEKSLTYSGKDADEQRRADALIDKEAINDQTVSAQLDTLRSIKGDVLDEGGARFSDVVSSPDLLDGLTDMGWDVMSKVQAQAAPRVLEGRDVVVRSLNGTGKTASFLIPVLDSIDVDSPTLQALVVLPTYILSNQTFDVAREMGRNIPGLNMMVVRPPEECSLEELLEEAQDIHVIFCCPGRIIAMFRKDPYLFESLRLVVFDEADALFGENFYEQSKQLLAFVPSTCHRVFASATYPLKMFEFVKTYMKDPVFVDPYQIRAGQKIPVPDGLSQFYVFLEEKKKILALRALFSRVDVTKCIIFCSSVRRVALVKDILDQMKYPCVCFFRNKDDPDFEKNLKLFRRNPKIKYLVTSDIAARGIDIPSVNVVVQFDFTPSPYTYLHRAGRAVRFGQVGISITFVTDRQQKDFLKLASQFDKPIEHFPKEVDVSLYK